jgi:hypothetical protein
MFKLLNKIFGTKPVDESLLAKRVDAMPVINDQITDSVTQTMQAQVADKIKKPTKPRTKKTK